MHADGVARTSLTRLVDALRDHFGEALRDVVAAGVLEEPWPQLRLTFTLYDFAVIDFVRDVGPAAFSIASGPRNLPLGVTVPADALDGRTELGPVLVELEAAVKLRIPEQYLATAPWQSAAGGLARRDEQESRR